MISFQKIYGLYGLENHTVEINGDVTMETDRQTDVQTDKQVNIELLSQWTLDSVRLSFAIKNNDSPEIKFVSWLFNLSFARLVLIIEYLESGLTASLIKLGFKFQTIDKITPLRAHNNARLETLSWIDKNQIRWARAEILNLWILGSSHGKGESTFWDSEHLVIMPLLHQMSFPCWFLHN